MVDSDMIDHRYFYFRDAQRRPMVTLAMVRRWDGAVGYGWSVCRADEQPFYRRMVNIYDEVLVSGRELALGRAMAAFANRGVQIADGVFRYSRPISRVEAIRTIEACQANGLLALAWHNTTTALPLTMQPPLERPPHHGASEVSSVD